MGTKEQGHDGASREAEKILDRVARESETVGTSSTRRAVNHMMASEVDPNDRTELWGRRIGRGLSILFLFALMFYLVHTYICDRQHNAPVPAAIACFAK